MVSIDMNRPSFSNCNLYFFVTKSKLENENGGAHVFPRDDGQLQNLNWCLDCDWVGEAAVDWKGDR